MNITLNNYPEHLPGDILTIREILKLKNFTFPNLVVKINHELVKKTQWDEASVKEGDNV
jgi:thiamine biosynthesis protein ThiS